MEKVTPVPRNDTPGFWKDQNDTSVSPKDTLVF